MPSPSYFFPVVEFSLPRSLFILSLAIIYQFSRWQSNWHWLKSSERWWMAVYAGGTTGDKHCSGETEMEAAGGERERGRWVWCQCFPLSLATHVTTQCILGNHCHVGFSKQTKHLFIIRLLIWLTLLHLKCYKRIYYTERKDLMQGQYLHSLEFVGSSWNPQQKMDLKC